MEHPWISPAAAGLVPSHGRLSRKPARSALRSAFARLLRHLAAGLMRTARSLSHPSGPGRRPARPGIHELPALEFHAMAGAPEGALYVDGVYVGTLEVSRL